MCREDPENRKKLNRYIIIIFKKLKNTCKCSQNLKFYIQGGNTLGIAEINLKNKKSCFSWIIKLEWGKMQTKDGERRMERYIFSLCKKECR